MTIDDDIAFFERVPTLSMLGRGALRILAIGAESRYVHDGDVLFREGEVADAGYVVQEGSFTLASGNARIGVEPVTVGPGANVLGALSEMSRRRIRHLPVVEDGRLTGIVSIGDLVAYRIARVEEEAEAMRSYIQGS